MPTLKYGFRQSRQIFHKLDLQLSIWFSMPTTTIIA